MEEKVLVIEDDVEINELLGEYLALEHLNYISALDGHSGLTKTTMEHPKAIVLDLMLPDIDGYEVCKILASRRATACIPVVILTCMNQKCDREKAVAAGAIRFMNKPFLPDELLANLNEAFAWRDGLRTRPPQGTFTITAGQPEPAFRAIREMIADLFSHSALADQSISAIWEGMLFVVDWLNRWSQENKRPATLTLSYRLLAKSNLAGPDVKADAIEWVFTETAPALLAQTILKVTPPAAAKEPAPELASPWRHLLTKLGVSRFDKDTKAQKVTVIRHFAEPTQPAEVPILTIDGTRIPGRTLHEAIATKPQ